MIKTWSFGRTYLAKEPRLSISTVLLCQLFILFSHVSQGFGEVNSRCGVHLNTDLPSQLSAVLFHHLVGQELRETIRIPERHCGVSLRSLEAAMMDLKSLVSRTG